MFEFYSGDYIESLEVEEPKVAEEYNYIALFIKIENIRDNDDEKFD